ncbi:hypothetical protein BURCENBC7_AP3359 [Burkholderia cenocepacia BC7]|nr:hypothetical protein BURCENK562V_C2966 [Burkholderia cenocepacia K56-2Valvano]ERI28982.1 hypothetical protein BURCENBC7_AP3359 [Burkholderia cenocepacia BC7]
MRHRTGIPAGRAPRRAGHPAGACGFLAAAAALARRIGPVIFSASIAAYTRWCAARSNDNEEQDNE